MKRVLSIDGGGVRGIIPLTILKHVEEITGRRIADMFDLIVGTSAGGIAALALAHPKQYSAKEVLDHYYTLSRRVFRADPWHKVTSLGGATGPRYHYSRLKDNLDKVYLNTLMAECATPTMVTAYNIHKRQTLFLKSWKDGWCGMSEAGLATSAAPTYFRPLKLTRKLVAIDGGVCVNNPAMCAYAEARKLWPEEQDVRLLSIGTGQSTRRIPYDDAKDWGVVGWMGCLLNIIGDGESDAVNYQLENILGKDKYLRLQTQLDIANDDMDDASNANLQALNKEALNIISKLDASHDVFS